MKNKNKNTTSCSQKIITKWVITNFAIDVLCPFHVDKRLFRDLVVLMFGIILPTPHNSTRSFCQQIPGSPDPSNLNKSLHTHGTLFQKAHWATILSSIIWCMSLKDVYPGTPVYFSIDETFIPKSAKQKSLEDVYYCGHKKRHGFYIVASHLQIGKYHVPCPFLIHKRNTKQTKQQLALQLVKQIQPLLSMFTDVTVLTDSAYAEKELMSYVINTCKYKWIGAIKRNRTMDGKSVYARFKYIQNAQYQSVRMYKRHFLTAGLQGHLNDSSSPGLFIVTKTKKKSYTPVSWRYYYCSDPSQSVQEVLRQYQNRWRIENDFWTLKEHLMMDDFRYRDESAVQTYLSLVLMVYTWMNHLKNLEMVRVKKEDVPYGACDMLVKVRNRIQSFFLECGTEGLKILQEEFVTAQSRMVPLE